MQKKIKQFLLPQNSNAKNRNSIFLWFLLCFLIAVSLGFLNGYNLGKCQKEESSISVISIKDCDSSKAELNKTIKELHLDSLMLRQDIKSLIEGTTDPNKNVQNYVDAEMYPDHLGTIHLMDADLIKIRTNFKELAISYKDLSENYKTLQSNFSTYKTFHPDPKKSD